MFDKKELKSNLEDSLNTIDERFDLDLHELEISALGIKNAKDRLYIFIHTLTDNIIDFHTFFEQYSKNQKLERGVAVELDYLESDLSNIIKYIKAFSEATA